MMQKEANPNSLIYDPKVLMQEFKNHIYRLDHKNAPSKMNNQYKKIYSELIQSNKAKKQRLTRQQQHSLNIHRPSTSRMAKSQRILRTEDTQILFRKTQNRKEQSLVNAPESGLLQGMLSMVASNYNNEPKVTSDSLCLDLLHFAFPAMRTQSAQKAKDIDPKFLDLEQRIMMESMFKEKLQKEIGDLKQSHTQVKKDLENSQKEHKLQATKQSKYKQVSYLSQSVQQQTDHVMINNVKDFKQMVKKQEATIANLRKYRNNLRKQNDQMEAKYLSGNKARLKQQRPQTYNFKSTQDRLRLTDSGDIKSTIRTSPFLSRNIFKFIESIESVLGTLKENQQDYEQIKATECTKIRNMQNINTDLLDEQRARKLNQVYRFQNKFEMRLQSSGQIIAKVFKRLNEKNEQREKLLAELNKSKQEYEDQIKFLLSKQQMDFEQSAKVEAVDTAKDRMDKLEAINNNSKLLIQFVNLFYLMLMKFKYMFRMALTLNLEKKNFSEYMFQIDKVFEEGLYFQGLQTDSFKHLSAACKASHDSINIIEFRQIVQKHFSEVPESNIRENVQCAFNDFRFVLIIRKSGITQDLQNTGKDQLSFQKFMETLSLQCEQIYNEKLKALTNLFLNCLKSINLSKFQRKLINSSVCKAFQTEIFLPNRRAKRISQYLDSTDTETCPKAMLDAHGPQNRNESWSPAKGDPRGIVLKLSKMRNNRSQKFKLLNFNVEGNSYAKKVQKFENNLRSKNGVPFRELANGSVVE